jgi:hypothetical protein
MKFSTKKTKLTATVVIALLVMSSLMLLATTQAQMTYENLEEGGAYTSIPTGVTPDLTLPTEAYLSFRPNPVGLDQVFLVNMWLTPSTHVSRYMKDYTVTIQKPDGTEIPITMDSYRADTTAWFEYVADQVGTWKLRFEFPGGYFPAGNYTTHEGAVFSQQADQITSFTQSVYYEPSSTDWQELEVQEEMVYGWPDLGLPTDYWTRPISPEHREWATISGWYPYTGMGGGNGWPADTNIYASNYDFTPYVQAPETSHVVWKEPKSLAGLVGSDWGTFSLLGGGGFGGSVTPSIIFNGRCYGTATKAMLDGTSATMWQCYDLRTGEMYWEQQAQTTTMLIFGTFEITTSVVPDSVHLEQGHGEVPGAIEQFGTGAYLVGITGDTLRKWDPFDGSLDLEVPAMDGTLYSDPYVFSVQNLGDFMNPEYRLIKWSVNGATANFAERVVSNITWPLSSLGSVQDFESMVSVQVSAVNDQASGAEWVGVSMTAVDMNTGNILWTKDVNERYYSTAVCVADHGKVAVLMKDGDFWAWDLRSGDLAWQSEQMDYPWDAPSFGAYAIQSAYGMIYREAYSGIYAFDWDTGKIAWKYEGVADSPYETPYVAPDGTPTYSFNAGGVIADGKLYMYNTEHTETQPITRGWGIHCIDAYTGEGVWSMTGFLTPGGMADGYLTAVSRYDGYMYVFGKGKSETTVTAPETTVPVGTAVLIKGSVLDMSPAQEGTPCVSEDSMTTQMEYLHQQRPIDGIYGDQMITGVPVALCAMKDDGTYVDLGTVITDGYYGTFSTAWTPDSEGVYKIIASFAGDKSYGSSDAATAVSIGPSTSATGQIEPEPLMSTEVAIILGAIAAAVIIVVAFFILRKRE